MTLIELLMRQPVAQAIGWALLQFVWQGAVLGLLTAVVLAVLRRSAPDIRYVVSTIGLLLMLTMPIVTAWQSATNAVPARATIAAETGEYRVPSSHSTTTARARGSAPSVQQRTVAHPVAPAPAVVDAPENIESYIPWMPLVVFAWMCGVLVLSLRLASGWLWVQTMKRRRASAAADYWQQMSRKLARQLHIRRPIRLLESAAVGVPIVIGWLRPVVLLPASALAGLSPQQIEAILAHELAHVRRHDYLVNLLQTLVETLLFYHPAVWWLSRRIRAERENCCDDLAVSLCGDPYAYAKALADLEELRGTSGRLVLAASGGSLLQRVRRLVGAPPHAGRGPGWAAGFAALLLMTGVAGGAIGNELLLHDGRSLLGSNLRSWERDGGRLELRVRDAADAVNVLAGARDATRAFAEGARDATRAFAEGGRDAMRALAQGARDASRAVAGGARDAKRALANESRRLRGRQARYQSLEDLPPLERIAARTPRARYATVARELPSAPEAPAAPEAPRAIEAPRAPEAPQAPPAPEGRASGRRISRHLQLVERPREARGSLRR